MKQSQSQTGSPYEFYGKIPLRQAIPLGLQHVLAMFVGNLTPILLPPVMRSWQLSRSLCFRMPC